LELTIQIDKKNNLRKHEVKGVISVLELKQHLESYYKSSMYGQSLNSLWDLRDADFSEVKPEQIKKLAEMVGRYWGGPGEAKSALVVSRDLDYGLTRMYEIILSTINSNNVRVFRNIRAAEEWMVESDNRT
jgi:hypothetical protein